MGDAEESFVTRKPLEFTLIVLFIILLLLTPVHFYLKYKNSQTTEESKFLTETYSEVDYWFGADSDLTEDDKRILFNINYKGNVVQWTGRLVECTPQEERFIVSMAHKSLDFSDVIFTTEDDCTDLPLGKDVNYKMKLLEWKINAFIGEEGELPN